MASGRKVVSAIRLFVVYDLNVKENLFMPVLLYGSEIKVGREKEIFSITGYNLLVS